MPKHRGSSKPKGSNLNERRRSAQGEGLPNRQGPLFPVRVTLAISPDEHLAMTHVARKRNLRDRRGRLAVSPLLRDQSLAEIVREYRRDAERRLAS